MNIYKRHFKIPLVSDSYKQAEACSKKENEYQEQILAIGKELGANGYSVNTLNNQFTGFVFKGKSPEGDFWKRPNGHSYEIKKSHKEGKALLKRIAEIPLPPKKEDYLQGSGLIRLSFALFDHGNAVAHGVGFSFAKDSYFFVSVPWSDNPECDNENGEWTPPSDWQEVKNWEMERDIDAGFYQ